MSHVNEAADIWGLENPTPEQALADDNLRAQEHLWESLAVALRDSERSIEDVAARLGIPADLAEDISNGRVDVSLSDLREFAYAIDAFVTYRVSSRYTSNLENYRRSLANVPQHWHRSHQSSPAETVFNTMVEKLASGR
ncbi:hypothetical protein ACFRAU_07220 [Arthrobacter sp. NPDC056691]|uniref:hypothetical protein n=1 Tax=Arthrobacter sp. NPDC056691 TaxID=3345913 RepID=UPI0036731225